MQGNHITHSSTPLNTSGGRKTERPSQREGEKNDGVGLEHQTINSPLSLWVEGFFFVFFLRVEEEEGVVGEKTDIGGGGGKWGMGGKGWEFI